MPFIPAPPADGRCVRNERRDFVEWHRGRQLYVLWALDVDLPPLQPRWTAARAHLDGLLLDGYRRQPHVTLSVCGFPCERPRHHDDFGANAFAAQLAALRAARPRPFDIAIGGLGSFASVPFLAVADADAGIATLRHCLAGGRLDRTETHYTPHVTLGLYADAWPVAAVVRRFRDFPTAAPLPLRIAHIQLVGYRAAEVGGPLLPLADYDLADGSLHWHGTPLFG